MNIKHENISCIILAGGKGNRFGNQDKGLLELDNKPLIEHVINAIKPQVDDIVISANRNIGTYNNYSESVIKDSDSAFCGPLAGIASAIPLCKHEWILVVPCDMPLLPSNLVDTMKNNISEHKMAIVETNDRLQLVFLMHDSLLASIRNALEQEHYKLMSWVQSQSYIAVQFSNDTVFNNVNSPGQLTELN